MKNIAGQKPALLWATHLAVAFMVILWIIPTFGLLVSSFRTGDQISTSGWWKSLFATEQVEGFRIASPEDQVQEGDLYVIEGNVFTDGGAEANTLSAWGTSSRDVSAYAPGDVAELRDGGTITIAENGDYRLENSEPFEGSRGRGSSAPCPNRPPSPWKTTIASFSPAPAPTGCRRPF